MKRYLRRTWAEVDIHALKHNFDVIRQAADPKAQIMCVIKADAYGHGAVFLGKLYEKMGAQRLAVSNIEEAMQLRDNGIRLPVLILGFTPANLAKVLADNNISQAVFSEEYAKELSDYAVKDNVNVKIHIKLDTGMSRIGFMYQNIERDAVSVDQIERVCRMPHLIHEGVFTHFAVSDEGDEGRAATIHQYECFDDAVQKLKARNITFALVHCSNSGAIIDYKQVHCNCVRAGIILYGLSPSSKLEGRLDLRPAMQIKSVIAQIKTVEPNTPLSYGGTFITKKATKVATVPIGYADGYTRSLGNRAFMTVNGQKAPVIGRVCMDQLMLDISGVDDVKVGDEITVIGDGSDNTFSFDDMAEMTGTINYELVCLVGKRVPRVYIHHGKNVGIMDSIRPNKSDE
ncbi:MAG: alanine racemase [Clostridia bacterium]|nr:alanine racemase [Clostridia bacterium]